MHRVVGVLFVCAIGVIAGCGRTPPPEPSPAPAPEPARIVMGEAPRDLPGLPNVVRVSEKLLSGGAPEGDEGFATLRSLGVKSVITVDGAKPEVEHARRFGLRYVHLPIGYDGVPRTQALRIARAIRDLPGQVYIHCHHGKHRSPAAAAAATRCLDSHCSADMAKKLMQRAGTAPHYQGLYATAQQMTPVSARDLDRVSGDFPEIAAVEMLVEHMVDLETRWNYLQQIRAAGWRAPAGHADLDPAHEALLLREAYRESARLPEVKKRSATLVEWFAEAEQHAAAIQEQLRLTATRKAVDAVAAEKAYQSAAADCTHCHARFRDQPRP